MRIVRAGSVSLAGLLLRRLVGVFRRGARLSDADRPEIHVLGRPEDRNPGVLSLGEHVVERLLEIESLATTRSASPIASTSLAEGCQSCGSTPFGISTSTSADPPTSSWTSDPSTA